MFKKAYIAIGLILIGGYSWWSFTGKELVAAKPKPEPIPKNVPYSSSSGHSSRSRSGYFGFSSGGWGK